MLYPNEDWVFQQDGAPAHTSKTTQEYLDGATPDFIRKVAYAEPGLQPDGLCGLGLVLSKGLCRETGQIHRERTKKTDSKVLVRHYPRRNTKHNISLENALGNSGS